ncbi:MAG: DUF1800 domain-containing protein [Gammaproteobacteria bacterium]|nr:DUF1800 domain-containing protein [Gammaproteobacteria bacterium]
MNKARLLSTALSFMLSLSACGGSSGGGGSPPPPPPPPPAPITTAEAFQFLNQTTFGATLEEAQSVIDMRYEAWIDQEMSKNASLQLPHLRSLPRPQFLGELHSDRVDIWFRNSVDGFDQLRQRVAFALSEILVVSQQGALINAPYGVADYYDKLALFAFGNYRELMEVVTLHPAMGVYLSMLGNEKPNPALSIRPDENYARELMQLFSIGLVELNIDGTVRTDGMGQAIPTYDQSVIEGFAHVFTGWNYAGAPSFPQAFQNDNNQTVPMQLYPDFHDTGAKTLLNGFMIPAGQTGDQDLQMALDNIFNHPNVGPFIATRLIHRLVTSNPSPGYVARVATVFNNNGFGERGDLGAVVKAILLDPEARPAMHMEIDGKVKEPLLRLTQLWRAYDATSQSGVYPLAPAYIIFGQGPLQASHVFNFFSPFYSPPGEIRNSGLVAPELQIATEYQNTFVTNYFFLLTFDWNSEKANPGEDEVLIDIADEIAIADDTDALIDLVADKLLAGDISPTLRAEMVNMIDQVRVALPGNNAALAAEAIYFVVTSPEFAYQL